MAIFVTDAVFLFLSMKDYKDSMSSSCLECSFWKDIFMFLLIGMGVLAILLIILFRIVKKRGYLYGLILISLLSIFYSIDYVLFVDRVLVVLWSKLVILDQVTNNLIEIGVDALVFFEA